MVWVFKIFNRLYTDNVEAGEFVQLLLNLQANQEYIILTGILSATFSLQTSWIFYNDNELISNHIHRFNLDPRWSRNWHGTPRNTETTYHNIMNSTHLSWNSPVILILYVCGSKLDPLSKLRGTGDNLIWEMNSARTG